MQMQYCYEKAIKFKNFNINKVPCNSTTIFLHNPIEKALPEMSLHLASLPYNKKETDAILTLFEFFKNSLKYSQKLQAIKTCCVLDFFKKNQHFLRVFTQETTDIQTVINVDLIEEALEPFETKEETQVSYLTWFSIGIMYFGLLILTIKLS